MVFPCLVSPPEPISQDSPIIINDDEDKDDDDDYPRSAMIINSKMKRLFLKYSN